MVRRKATHVLILAHGDPPSPGLLARLVGEADLFLVTDGAANALAEDGLTPDVVLGDFDSLTREAKARLPGAQFVSAWNQEASDLEKAILWAREHGATRITLTGAEGGRLDHTLTAVSLLIRYHAGVDIRIVDDRGEARALSGEMTLNGRPGDTLSLVCFAPVEGVSATGVRWPLREDTLYPGSRGVSNEFAGETATVRVERGVLIVCHLPAGRTA